MSPCNHDHFDGALHRPCYQCRAEHWESLYAGLAESVKGAQDSYAAMKAENAVLLESLERIFNATRGYKNEPAEPLHIIALVRAVDAAIAASKSQAKVAA